MPLLGPGTSFIARWLLAGLPVQVRSSSVASKREFLQRKGLSEAEIDEAFRRVPQQAAAAPSVPAAATPGVATPAAVASTLQHLQPGQPLSYLQPPQGQLAYAQPPQGMQQHQLGQGPGGVMVAAPPPQQQGVRWTQVRRLLGSRGKALLSAHKAWSSGRSVLQVVHGGMPAGRAHSCWWESVAPFPYAPSGLPAAGNSLNRLAAPGPHSCPARRCWALAFWLPARMPPRRWSGPTWRAPTTR